MLHAIADFSGHGESPTTRPLIFKFTAYRHWRYAVKISDRVKILYLEIKNILTGVFWKRKMFL